VTDIKLKILVADTELAHRVISYLPVVVVACVWGGPSLLGYSAFNNCIESFESL